MDKQRVLDALSTAGFSELRRPLDRNPHPTFLDGFALGWAQGLTIGSLIGVVVMLVLALWWAVALFVVAFLAGAACWRELS